MKQSLLMHCTALQLKDLHDAYLNIIDVYEDICGGPTTCRDIVEYQAAWRNIRIINNILKEIQQ